MQTRPFSFFSPPQSGPTGTQDGLLALLHQIMAQRASMQTDAADAPQRGYGEPTMNPGGPMIAPLNISGDTPQRGYQNTPSPVHGGSAPRHLAPTGPGSGPSQNQLNLLQAIARMRIGGGSHLLHDSGWNPRLAPMGHVSNMHPTAMYL